MIKRIISADDITSDVVKQWMGACANVDFAPESHPQAYGELASIVRDFPSEYRYEQLKHGLFRACTRLTQLRSYETPSFAWDFNSSPDRALCTLYAHTYNVASTIDAGFWQDPFKFSGTPSYVFRIVNDVSKVITEASRYAFSQGYQTAANTLADIGDYLMAMAAFINVWPKSTRRSKKYRVWCTMPYVAVAVLSSITIELRLFDVDSWCACFEAGCNQLHQFSHNKYYLDLLLGGCEIG